MHTVFLENLLVAQPVNWKSEGHCRVYNSQVLAFNPLKTKRRPFYLKTQSVPYPRSQQASGRAARLLRSWVRIPPEAWIFDCCECRVLSGRGLCDELITRPEESYRLCCVVVCDLETSRIGAPYTYDFSNLRVKRRHKNSYFLCLNTRDVPGLPYCTRKNFLRTELIIY